MSDKEARYKRAQKSDYKTCWNVIAEERSDAYLMVDQSPDEATLVKGGRFVADALKIGLALNPADTVLEIGCGVARVGRELAPHVGKWIGVDVSENMLRIATERLAGFRNVELVAVDGSDLRPIRDASVDKMYAHAVFIHLDKEDLFNYLCEARRVLKPDGLFVFDVWNLCHPAGWLRWEWERAMYRNTAERPVHRNQFSTPDEIAMMLSKAGLVPVFTALTFSIQVVASHPPEGAGTDWLAKIAARYDRCYEHLRWRDVNIAEFEKSVRTALEQLGVGGSQALPGDRGRGRPRTRKLVPSSDLRSKPASDRKRRPGAAARSGSQPQRRRR